METPKYISFTSIPLPELRMDRSHVPLLGAETVTGIRRGERIIHLRLLSAAMKHKNDTFELVAPEKDMAEVLRLLAGNIDTGAVSVDTPHMTMTELPDGDLLVALKKDGRAFIAADGRAGDMVQGGNARITSDTVHPTLRPPFVVSGERMWYHRETQKKPTGHFERELYEMGWVRMRRYVKA
jgi:hypothetical protein